jgi:hypothetical protein
VLGAAQGNRSWIPGTVDIAPLQRRNSPSSYLAGFGRGVTQANRHRVMSSSLGFPTLNDGVDVHFRSLVRCRRRCTMLDSRHTARYCKQSRVFSPLLAELSSISLPFLNKVSYASVFIFRSLPLFLHLACSHSSSSPFLSRCPVSPSGGAAERQHSQVPRNIRAKHTGRRASVLSRSNNCPLRGTVSYECVSTGTCRWGPPHDTQCLIPYCEYYEHGGHAQCQVTVASLIVQC